MKRGEKFNWRETHDLLIEFVYLAAIFIVPLYFSIIFPTNNIFDLSKLSIFKILVWILLFLTLTKIILVKRFELTKNSRDFFKKYFLIPLIFILGLGASLFFSINPSQSFFGSYERQAGYLSYLFYFVWFALLVYNILTVDNRLFRSGPKDSLEHKVKRILATINFSAFLVALYGIFQIFGLDFLTWQENPLLTSRAISTFGQPNFLASWLVLVIPLSVYLIYKSKKLFTRLFNILVFVAELACLFFTASRGGIIALVIVALIYFIYLFAVVKIKVKHKLFIGAGVLAILIVGFWGMNFLLPGRLNSLVDIKGGSFAVRINYYSAAVDAIMKKPLFGYGLENGGEVFISYYRPDWGIFANVGSSTDKAHNLILDITLASGIFGLALFVLLYYYFFRLAIKNILEIRRGALSLALALGAAAYLISLMFSFSVIVAEIYFWLYLALLIVLSVGERGENAKSIEIETKRKLILSGKIVLILLLAAITAGGIYYESRVLTADYYFFELKYALAGKQYFTAYQLAGYIRSEKTNPISQEYYNRYLGDTLSSDYLTMPDLSTKKVAQLEMVRIKESLIRPSFENVLTSGRINFALGNYSLATQYFNEVARRAPEWPNIYIELARLYSQEKDFGNALLNYQKALFYLPDLNDVRLSGAHREIVSLDRDYIFQALKGIENERQINQRR